MSGALALAAEPSVLDRAADPGEFIIQACDRAKSWLREALDHGDIAQIAECKSRAEAIRVYAMSRQLGKDAQFAATEIIRRAERGIGVAIRRGQQDGEIRSRGQSRVVHQPGNNGLVASPTDFATEDELTGNRAGIYHLTDGVPEEMFEQVLAAAKAEGNLSRSNLVRKIRQRRSPEPARRDPQPAGRGEQVPGPADWSQAARQARLDLIARYAAGRMSSRQIGELLGISDRRVRELARDHQIEIPADAVVGRTRRLDSARIVREIASQLEGMAMSIELASLAELDPAEAAEWAASIARSARALSRFARQIKEVAQQ
jgi:hypothetical protein